MSFGFHLPFQRRLSRLYNDIKKSSDFVDLKEPAQLPLDLHVNPLQRKLRIQKDRLVDWGQKWSEPTSQQPQDEINEPLQEAGLSETVGILSTIKSILEEAEPLWRSYRAQVTSKDSKSNWDQRRFEDLLENLKTSIDTLNDPSRTGSTGTVTPPAARKPNPRMKQRRNLETSSIQTPQLINPKDLRVERDLLFDSFPRRLPLMSSSRQIVSIDKPFETDVSQPFLRPSFPMLLEFAPFDPTYAKTGITPPWKRFEKLSVGLQQETRPSPDSWNGLPGLVGYFEVLERSEMGLLYRFPWNFNLDAGGTARSPFSLRTLREILSQPGTEPPLEVKFRLAANLTNTIFDMHTRGISHGMIMDTNVSFGHTTGQMDTDTSKSGLIDYRRPLLSSFNLFPASGALVDTPRSITLFKHPLDPQINRTSLFSSKGDFRVLDLYSLAISLVSIGLWTKVEDLPVISATIDATAQSPQTPVVCLDTSRTGLIWEQLATRCGTLYLNTIAMYLNSVDRELSGHETGDTLLRNIQTKVIKYLEACCKLDRVGDLGSRLDHHPPDILRNDPPSVIATERTDQEGQVDGLMRISSSHFPAASPAEFRIPESLETPDLTRSAVSTSPRTVPVTASASSSSKRKRTVPEMVPEIAPELLPRMDLPPQSHFDSMCSSLHAYDDFVLDPFIDRYNNMSLLSTKLSVQTSATTQSYDSAVYVPDEDGDSSAKKVSRVAVADSTTIERAIGDQSVSSTGSAMAGRTSLTSNKSPVDSTGLVNTMINPPPGKSLAQVRLYPQVPLGQDYIKLWNSVMPQINMALRSFYKTHRESVEISLESIGASPQDSIPTVLIVCTSVAKVRTILRKKMGQIFDSPASLSLKVCSGRVVRSHKQIDTARSVGNCRGSEQELSPANCEYQPIPKNGASIGAWIGDRHLSPVGFGGLVIVDGKIYGMTVHHMLDDLEAAEELEDSLRQNSADDELGTLPSKCVYLPGTHYNSSDEYACEFSDSDGEPSDSDLGSDYADSESDESDELEDDQEPGDIRGVMPGSNEGYIVTQPAMDDVDDDFYPCVETADQDHLDTFCIGDVYASSGIRRRHQDGLVHEVDWALFEFREHRLPPSNVMPVLRESNDITRAAPCPSSVSPISSLPGLQIQCVARTSGLQTGFIMPAIASVKIFGRTSPSHAYQVFTSTNPFGTDGSIPSHAAKHLGDEKSTLLGVPGDSGAWIVGRESRELCGHVLAWSTRKRIAYMCPMAVLIEDIAETLSAHEVKLPGGSTLARAYTGHEAGGPSIQQTSETEAPNMDSSELEDSDRQVSVVSGSDLTRIPRQLEEAYVTKEQLQGKWLAANPHILNDRSAGRRIVWSPLPRILLKGGQRGVQNELIGDVA